MADCFRADDWFDRVDCVWAGSCAFLLCDAESKCAACAYCLPFLFESAWGCFEHRMAVMDGRGGTFRVADALTCLSCSWP